MTGPEGWQQRGLEDARGSIDPPTYDEFVRRYRGSPADYETYLEAWRLMCRETTPQAPRTP